MKYEIVRSQKSVVVRLQCQYIFQYMLAMYLKTYFVNHRVTFKEGHIEVENISSPGDIFELFNEVQTVIKIRPRGRVIYRIVKIPGIIKFKRRRRIFF